MAELYDQGFNGGFAEVLLSKVGSPVKAATDGATIAITSELEEHFTVASLAAAGNATGTKEISINGVTWSINGGGYIVLADDDELDIEPSTEGGILVLSGNGSWGVGTHNYNFANIKPTAGKGIRLIAGFEGVINAYSVLIRIKKEAGFGTINPR